MLEAMVSVVSALASMDEVGMVLLSQFQLKKFRDG
jgi:hypothetical protein